MARMAVPAAAKRFAAARAAVKSRVSFCSVARFCAAVQVAEDLFAVELVVVGQDVGVGHVEDFEAEDAGLLLLIDEGWVGELGEPVVVVEGGVVDAVGAVGADVGGGHAEVLDEGGVVGAGAEVADADVGVSGGRLRGRWCWCLLRPGRLLPLVIDCAALGAGDFFGDLANELFERGDGGGVEVGAGDPDVGVEVGDGVGEDFVVLLGPLGGAIRPSSSASQLPTTMVRSGFQPCLRSSPRPWTVSSMAAVPELGSTAP